MDIKKTKILVAVLIVAIGGYFLSAALNFILFAYQPAHEQGEAEIRKEIILVKSGLAPITLSRELHKKGIITDIRKFLKLGTFLKKWKKMKVGEYEVHTAMTPIEVLSVITSGVSLSHRLVVQEGKNMFQVAEKLSEMGLVEKKKFLQLAKSKTFLEELGFPEPVPNRIEGYLFPDTYLLNRTMSEKDILRMMYRRFRDVWNSDEIQSLRKLGMNRHEIITLASVVEKETGAKFERPLISSVFHNRIKKRMRLQSDPTTIYGIWEKFDGNLRRRHLKEKNDYNTYGKRGLPIGPIANPGREAIKAVLKPATSKYLYFVSKNDGTHQFTTNLKDHRAAVRKYQMSRSARKGKSWRDLKKRKEQSANR